MTAEQKAYLQALADVRSWHRWQINQALGDMRTVQVHESAIAWLDEVIAAKKQHAAEDEAERRCGSTTALGARRGLRTG